MYVCKYASKEIKNTYVHNNVHIFGASDVHTLYNNPLYDDIPMYVQMYMYSLLTF